MTTNVSCLVKAILLICEGSKTKSNSEVNIQHLSCMDMVGEQKAKMTLEEQIKHYRKQAGLSQEKMAEKIGVSIASDYKIKIDDIKNGIDIDMNRFNDAT